MANKNPSLTPTERSATLEHLLQARSGIYHPSVRDDGGEAPSRGAHAPGEAFFYNNWSFNAAGIILEELSGKSLGVLLQEWLARPIGMQDFEPGDVFYEEGLESRFPAFRIRMSGRDLARFGVLIAQNGRWEDRQLIPEAWIEATFRRHSDLGNGVGYGYMWWLMPDSTYMATGTGGQKVIIDPTRDMVTVTRVNTGTGFSRAVWWNFGGRLNNSIVGRMRDMIAEAAAQP